MKQRVISAIVMLAIFIPLLIIGGVPFAILMLFLGSLALYELLKFKPKLPPLIKALTFLYTAILISYASKSAILNLAIDVNYLLIPLLVFLIFLVFINKPKIYNYQDAFFLIGIALFLGLGFGNLIRIRNANLWLIVYLFLISTMTDTFAYLIGSKFGRHKLAKKISPNKTFEGLIGGTIMGTIIATCFYVFLIKDYQNLFMLIILTMLLSLVGSLGDLIKSSIKRYEGVKDFSNLIPGHGGILDRLDSILFISLTYIVIANLF